MLPNVHASSPKTHTRLSVHVETRTREKLISSTVKPHISDHKNIFCMTPVFAHNFLSLTFSCFTRNPVFLLCVSSAAAPFINLSSHHKTLTGGFCQSQSFRHYSLSAPHLSLSCSLCLYNPKHRSGYLASRCCRAGGVSLGGKHPTD